MEGIAGPSGAAAPQTKGDSICRAPVLRTEMTEAFEESEFDADRVSYKYSALNRSYAD